LKKAFPRILLSAIPVKDEPSDFAINYGFSSEEIMANLIKTEDPLNSKHQNGSFALFVTPPTLSGVKGYFNRNMIFLLDRSGSMTGEPYNEAIRSRKFERNR
jgi:hypothetical protein